VLLHQCKQASLTEVCCCPLLEKYLWEKKKGVAWALNEDYDGTRSETCRMSLAAASDVHHFGSNSSVVYVTFLISLQRPRLTENSVTWTDVLNTVLYHVTFFV